MMLAAHTSWYQVRISPTINQLISMSQWAQGTLGVGNYSVLTEDGETYIMFPTKEDVTAFKLIFPT